MHTGGDVVVTMAVEPKESNPDALTGLLLIGIEQALYDFIQSLKEEFDDSEKRMIFVSVYSQAFIQGPLFLGLQNLHEDLKDSIAN